MRDYEYKFSVYHSPLDCTARVMIFDAYYLVADSGIIYDCTLKGGRVGLFSMYQDEVTWGDLQFNCIGELE